MINNITVTFDRQFVLDSDEIMAVRRAGIGSGTVVAWAGPSGDDRRWVLTFSGTPVVGGSLTDEIYDLTVLASRVHTGSAVGATMADNYTYEFHRLVSDANGDGDSDNGDLLAIRSTYGATDEGPEYHWHWDYTADGDVDNGDVIQARRRRGVIFKDY
jgi:hypothetical protein